MSSLIEVVKGFNNLDVYQRFYSSIRTDLENLGKKGERNRHIDYGHGKNLRFPIHLASLYPENEIFYLENSSWMDYIFTKLKYRQFTPDNFTFIKSPGEKTIKAKSSTMFFTLHHCENEKESIAEIRDHLLPGGLLIILDYDMKKYVTDYDQGMAKEIVTELFNSENEIKVRKKEKDFFESHTRIGAYNCVKECRRAGFKTKKLIVTDPRKLFLYVGEKQN
jgi:hypothetical protein